MYFTFTVNITIFIKIKNFKVLICIYLEFLKVYNEYILRMIKIIISTYEQF